MNIHFEIPVCILHAIRVAPIVVHRGLSTERFGDAFEAFVYNVLAGKQSATVGNR